MATAIHHQRRLVTGNPSRSALQRCVSTWNQQRFPFKSMNLFFFLLLLLLHHPLLLLLLLLLLLVLDSFSFSIFSAPSFSAVTCGNNSVNYVRNAINSARNDSSTAADRKCLGLFGTIWWGQVPWSDIIDADVTDTSPPVMKMAAPMMEDSPWK